MAIVPQSVRLTLGTLGAEGLLRLPLQPQGMILFAHGSGSGRLSPRNNYVADILYRAGLGSLLFDLLTETEDETYANRFDIAVLTARLIQAVRWVEKAKMTQKLPLGLFGASTGAAGALSAAAKLPQIKAVVSRGGRPDLAMTQLPKVRTPTLLIVGGEDLPVIEVNRQALKELAGIKTMEIIPGATHLFEEPGALKQVAELATHWFLKYLCSPPRG